MVDERIVSLIEQLDVTDLDVRLAAQRQLIACGSDAFEPLVEAMRRGSGARCWLAAKTISEIDRTRAVAPLIEALTGSSNIILRQIAAQVLGRLGGTQAVTALVEALADRSVLIQLAAAEALGKLGDARAIDPLLAALPASESSTLRYTIIRALGALGDPRAVAAILPYANDGDHHVRMQVAEALKKFGTADML